MVSIIIGKMMSRVAGGFDDIYGFDDFSGFSGLYGARSLDPVAVRHGCVDPGDAFFIRSIHAGFGVGSTQFGNPASVIGVMMGDEYCRQS